MHITKKITRKKPIHECLQPTGGVAAPHRGVRIIHVEFPAIRIVSMSVLSVRRYGMSRKRADDAVRRSGAGMPEMQETRRRSGRRQQQLILGQTFHLFILGRGREVGAALRNALGVCSMFIFFFALCFVFFLRQLFIRIYVLREKQMESASVCLVYCRARVSPYCRSLTKLTAIFLHTSFTKGNMLRLRYC